jgi:hypothetical protein
MQTHFLTLELDLQTAAALQPSILAALRQEGEPLRWAITQVDQERGKIQVEAVVTRSTAWPATTQIITV